MPPVALRPRSSFEIIDASVQLLRQHYKELVTTTALFMIPIIILQVIFPTVTYAPGQLPTLANSGGSFVTFAASIILGTMSGAAVIVIVSDSYLGRDVTIGAAVNRVVGRFGTVLAAAILQSLIMGIGFVFLIIPGLVFAAWFFATTNVVMVEGAGVFAALGRSRQLARGSVGRILGTIFLTALVLLVVQLLVGFVLGRTVPAIRTHANAATLVSYVVSIFIYPLLTVVITLLYYDLRIRKEAFDLELMAKELGFGSSAPASV